MVKGYFPDKGDVVWLQFNPQAGREQAGKRPALVLSPKEYNQKTGLALFCPITSKVKGYPFEVRLPEGFPVEGVILSDQIKNLDWISRSAQFACKIPVEILQEVVLKVGTLFMD
ncbi:toxin of the ChpA-ChpR toxin-antitoxin system, endoribonuclease [Candidatus Desulfosporosinus infrequens]|uniref:Toxin of the ChpA-ChpR toxin-antitoxin system, endoribonuclease n=1 Tax=Candidatus Desulfosporosinus infrequens TaxID=2043169 RepID=A0A2U3JZ47_9FIRM|nr:toxin of the ChpA-ChpR toxin-antitoxin system, endoribonuclease [Candidatus Desulfosporosinus infrequens]